MSDDDLPPLFERASTAVRRIAERVALGRGRVRDEQQLLSMVDQATELDLLEEGDRDYIHSIVEFGDTLVREVMVPRTDMVTVDSDVSVRSTLELLLNARHSRLPVIGGDVDEVLGVVYLRDASSFVLRRPEESEESPATRIMKPAMFVPEVQRADKLLRRMQQESNHLALVVDEYGGISGLVTLEDLIEEVIGDISDEHDRETPEVVEEAPGLFLVSAMLPIDDLGELFGIELDDEEVDTVGGLFAKWLGRLPEVGDRVTSEGIELEAIDTERRRKRLITARARAVQDPAEAADSITIEETP
ncbi:hemolysin family protein [Leucobacter komagatae]|uniref:hemolysin family protein n=1 Tax=Leucobacter komagatae TaxID=55969 RepID=UPI000A035684|nr:hemolysin family protein [Leucobacter komagatae]